MRLTDPAQAVAAITGRAASQDSAHNWDRLQRAIRQRDQNPRLKLVRCKSCQAITYWAERNDGGHSLRDLDGRSHNATCPDAEKWRRRATCDRVAQNLDELQQAQQTHARGEYIRVAWQLAELQQELIDALEDSGLNNGRLEELRQRVDFGWRKLRELRALLPEEERP